MENPGQEQAKNVWDDIIAILHKQADTYQEFNEFMKVKQKTIIKGDTNTLKEQEGKEKIFINRLEQLEDLRRQSAIECVGGQAPTLRDLLAGSPAEHKTELEGVAMRLMESINNVVITHKCNTELLEEAIHFVQFNLNLLTSSGAPTDSTYGATGQLRDAENKIKGLLNKQV